MPSLYRFFSALKYGYYFIFFLLLVGIKHLSKDSPDNYDIELIIHIFVAFLLWGLYIKKYNPNSIRVIAMILLLLEFTIGIFLKNKNLPYGKEVTMTGLFFILALWLNTHSNRHKFE